jgi:cob(I)alamin adenosyltransferase
VRYLNRLSDLLFILSRGANGGEEPLWQPGATQQQAPGGDADAGAE